MTERAKRYYAGIVSDISVMIAFASAVLVAECNKENIHMMYTFAIISALFSFICLAAMHFDDVQKFFVVFTVLMYSKLGKLSISKDSDFEFCLALRKRFNSDSEFCDYVASCYDKYINHTVIILDVFS